FVLLLVRLLLDLLVASSLSSSASAVLFFAEVALALFDSTLLPSVFVLGSAHKGLGQVVVVPLVSSLEGARAQQVKQSGYCVLP
ncbi:MAG: hypothetical protein ACKPKO_33275, partial [Candidatus Fonsibacter sp.]